MAAFGNSENGSDAAPCANNCGFYGNPETLNLCSVCYAAFLKETGKDSRRRESTDNVVRSRNLDTELVRIRDEEPSQRFSPSASQSSAASGSVADLNNQAPKTKIRCKICKKKVGLLGFNCRCGGSFCGKHRYPEDHSCDVDHKAIGREILAKQMVECKADKLDFRV